MDISETYLVFGGSSVGTNGNLDLNTLNGTNGYIFNGVAASDLSGLSVSSAGDVNGDGTLDLIVGAILADPGGRGDAGASYVVFGDQLAALDGNNDGTIELSALNGTTGFVINGNDAGEYSGFSVSSAGDVNGDNIDDLVVGAPVADPNGADSGVCYLVFGSTTVGSGGSFNLSSLVNGNGANGYVIEGAGRDNGLGWSLSAAGDVNNDSYDDLLIGAPGANAGAGWSYLGLGGNSAHFQTLDNADGTIDGVIDVAFIA